MELLEHEFGYKNSHFKYFDNLRVKHDRSRTSSQMSKSSRFSSKDRMGKSQVQGVNSHRQPLEESSLFQSSHMKTPNNYNMNMNMNMQSESPKFGGERQEISCILIDHSLSSNEKPIRMLSQKHCCQSQVKDNKRGMSGQKENRLHEMQKQVREKSANRKEAFKQNQEKVRRLRQGQKMDEKISQELKELQQLEQIANSQQQINQSMTSYRSRKYTKGITNSAIHTQLDAQKITVLQNYADNHYPKFLQKYYGFIPFKQLLIQARKQKNKAINHYNNKLKTSYFNNFIQKFKENLVDFQMRNKQQEYKVHQHFYQHNIPKYFFYLFVNQQKKQEKYQKYRNYYKLNLQRKIVYLLHQNKIKPQKVTKNNHQLIQESLRLNSNNKKLIKRI